MLVDFGTVAGNLANELCDAAGLIAMSSAAKVHSSTTQVRRLLIIVVLFFGPSQVIILFAAVLGQIGCKICVLTIHPNKNPVRLADKSWLKVLFVDLL
jgi:hypothetical protein